MFGKSRKRNALIMELVEHRMRLLDVDDLQIRLELKKMSGLKLMRLPEATLVAVVEIAESNQKKAILLQDTLSRLESTRKLAGQNRDFFERILLQASGSNPAKALIYYILYRIKIESRTSGTLFNLDIVSALTAVAFDEVRRW